MVEVVIRNVDDDLLDMYQGMADAAGISLEAQLVHVLAVEAERLKKPPTAEAPGMPETS